MNVKSELLLRAMLFFMVVYRAGLAFSTVDHWETVVYETNTWRYLVPSAAVSSTWINPGFNDTGWSQGSGGFGFGDGDDNTTISQTISCYQRINFTVTNVSAIEAMVFNIDFDDGYVAYLNGVEIARENLTSTGQPAYDQLADGQHEALMYQGGYPSTIFLDAAFVAANLVNGTNTLCVQTHNATANSSDMSSRVFLSLGINNASTDYGAVPGWFVAPLVFTDSNLPIVVINTAGGVAIPDQPKVDAVMGVIYNGEGVRNYLTDPFNEFYGNIGIETRGSSSQMFPKKQYSVETRDNFGNRSDVTMFNMAYDNDWVLYAPYSDKSLIRNVLAYDMGWDMGIYAPRTKLCEVVLNGTYQGVYVLTEKIKRKDGKVGTNDLEQGDVSGNELTGDYVIKIDKTTSGGVIAWNSPYPPYPGASQSIGFIPHDPSYDSLNATQLNYIENYITSFESALNGPNFSDPQLGYLPYVDINSFIQFFLINEVSHNVDGYRISSYLHKVRTSEGGKLYAGPLWDFNLAFGNANYCEGSNTGTWELAFYQYCSGDNWQNPFWWLKLTQDPTYAHAVSCTYQELRQGPWNTDSLMQRIDDLAAYLDEAQQRNFQQWPVLGNYVWPNNFIGNTYAEEINYLKSWLDARLQWLDANMIGTCADLGMSEFYAEKISVYPNPASTEAHVMFGAPVADARVEIVDMNGRVLYAREGIQGPACDLAFGGMDAGLYHIRVTDGFQVFTGKLIVE